VRGQGAGAIISGVGGAILFAGSFFPWYFYSSIARFYETFIPWNIGDDVFDNGNRPGWQYPGGPLFDLAVLLGLAMPIAVFVKAVNPRGTAPHSLMWPVIHLAAGVAAVALVVTKLSDKSSHLGFGFYLAIIGTAGLALGALLMLADALSARRV